MEARVYSGSSGPVVAATHNFVPVTLVDVRLQGGVALDQQLPASYNGFLYVLEGHVVVGMERTPLAAGQVGWLSRSDRESADLSRLRIRASDNGARLVLYAGQRQDVPIVMHGPFVGETRADLMRLSREYMEGKMPRISELAGDRVETR